MSEVECWLTGLLPRTGERADLRLVDFRLGGPVGGMLLPPTTLSLPRERPASPAASGVGVRLRGG